MKGLGTLSRGFTSLDASKPWICFWILHALDMLNALPARQLLERLIGNVVRVTASQEPYGLYRQLLDRVLDTILLCQNETGGFGGGFGQLSHLATTYAAVHAIAIIGLERGFNAIRRFDLLQFYDELRRTVVDWLFLTERKCFLGCCR